MSGLNDILYSIENMKGKVMKNIFNKNCCDGIYNSFDVHFTSVCDNQCKHCIDSKYNGIGIKKPDIKAITKTIIENKHGYDDVLFLGGEPCLFLEELIKSVKILKDKTNLKVFLTTSVPKNCYDKKNLFFELIDLLDGLNLSVQSHDENIADKIRCTKSKYDRQKFYNSLPHKSKIRINLNIVKPYFYTKKDIIDCLIYYDKMRFNSIKLSEIQHGKEYYISFEKIFNVNYGSPYFHGCQKYIDTSEILPQMKTPLLLKRSCFICEETLKASIFDSIKVIQKLWNKPKNKYSIIYPNGLLSKGWL